MMRSTFLIIIFVLGNTLSGVARHLDDIIAHNGWISSDNAAGISSLTDSLRLSDVAICYQYGRGGLTDYNGPIRFNEWAASASSLYRIDHRTVVYGSVSYAHRTGYEMAGSAWINPADQPFDLIEYTPDCAGRKVLESYRLTSSIAHTISSWSIGLKVDYEADNYAKQRDLRHQNRRMQMLISPGVKWSSDLVSLGLNYQYIRSTEGLSFNIAGNTDRQYITLVSYGAFIGMREYSATLYDGYSSVSGGDRPMVNEWHCISLQTALHQNRKWEWYNQWNLSSRKGYFGRETSYTIVYEDHDGYQLAWHSQLGFGQQEQNLWHHLCSFSVKYATLRAKERLWNEVQQGGGFTEYVYYDQQQRLNRKQLEVQADYTLRQEHWTWHSSLLFNMMNQKVSYYPIYRNQQIAQSQFSLSVERRWRQWEIGGSLIWQTGWGDIADDGTYGSADASTTLAECNHAMYQAYDYRTAPQGGVRTHFRYTARHNFYALLEYKWQHTLKGESFVNPSFNTIGLSIGHEF